ncbi:MAG: hypothetical protein MRZ42_02915 [Tenericutes bacterium]|nr:hypothetical protein [Mycoplasmatota bacterium]
MKTVTGTVIDLILKGNKCPTIVVAEYEIEGKKYTIKETLKLKSETIKLGIFPIGQKKTPKVRCKKGEQIIIEYDEKHPEKGHIKGNDGFLN